MKQLPDYLLLKNIFNTYELSSLFEYGYSSKENFDYLGWSYETKSNLINAGSKIKPKKKINGNLENLIKNWSEIC